jgi:chloramphenicol 3-O phosphotransferase
VHDLVAGTSHDKTGRVIFLNGTSSSGKTTIAKELQKHAQEPYLHLSLDAFLNQLPSSYLEDHAPLAGEFSHLLIGFYASSAAIARAGNNVIIDTVLQERSWVTPCIMTFVGLDVVFVGVRCSLEVLENREKARADRREGTARYQHDRVHAHGVYDIEVDTSVMPLGECVSRILNYVQSQMRPFAFRKLQAASGDRAE